MPSLSPFISVTTPVSQAIEHVKNILFRPFNMEKWLAMGFCAWLSYLGQGGFSGGGGPVNFGGGGRGGGQSLTEIRDWIGQNLHWLVPVVIGVAGLGLLLWVLFTWLSSRGHFMFLHSVALNRAEVRLPWAHYAHSAHSLFLFRIILGLITLTLMLPLLAVGGLVTFSMISHERAQAGAILLLVSLIGVGVLVGLAATLVAKFTVDFVVPIMFLRNTTCRTAWSEFLPLLRGHPLDFLLYILFQIVLQMGIALGVLLIVLITCCLAGCLLAIPYIGTVALLPVLAFKRSYSLYYFSQFGPQYNAYAARQGVELHDPPPGGA